MEARVNTALLVIDVQESFRHRPYWRDDDLPGFRARVYVTEATLTFPMTHSSGRVYSPAEIRERTEVVLAGNFARVATVAEALAAI